jgi:ethanolamine permease
MKKAERDVSGVEYVDVDAAEYLARRGLRRYARALHLWALGVGAVISGDFFGWNFGLAYGFWSLFVANVIITVMFVGLVFCIAEMASALPHTGAAYSFARSSMGPWGAYVTGLAENMEYVLTPAVIVVGVGGYLNALVPGISQPLWWAIAYAVFTALNVWGVEASFRFTLFVTALALLILAVFFLAAIPHVDFGRWAFAGMPESAFPQGIFGVLSALPFAVWFYLAIEELPLAAEETMDPARDIPRGSILGMATLTVLAFGTLFFSSAIAPGAAALAKSAAPLNEGFRTVFGEGVSSSLLTVVALAGLIASFHAIIFAYGRQIYSLSRAGYFPLVFSLTHPTRKTPYVALVTGSVMGWMAAYAIYASGQESPVGAVLLNMAVFGAMISYALQMASFVLLRLRHGQMPRPFRSPFGIPGALLVGVIAVVTLVVVFLVPAYQPGVIGVAVWYALGLLYFVVYGRHHLVAQAPEEEFALLMAARDELERS